MCWVYISYMPRLVTSMVVNRTVLCFNEMSYFAHPLPIRPILFGSQYQSHALTLSSSSVVSEVHISISITIVSTSISQCFIFETVFFLSAFHFYSRTHRVLVSIRCWVTSSVTVWKLLFKQQFKWIDFSLNQTAQPMLIMVYIANVAALTTRISFKSLQRKIPFSCIHKNNQQNSRNYLILLVQIIGDSWKARKCAATQYKQHQ